jgi:hypothetical protein
LSGASLKVSPASEGKPGVFALTLLKEWLAYYHERRPHQGLGNVPISAPLPPPEPLESFRLDEIVCREQLGGLLRHYERKAA